MALASAQAMAPMLRTRERDPADETEALLGIAAWASRFTPSVAIDFPDGLVLEVEGSLKLFGGLPALRAALRDGLLDLGYGADIAVAPTAKAAAWLARARHPGSAEDRSSVHSAWAEMLNSLPLEVMRCPEQMLEACALLGIETLGRLLALPRDGLARRFGQGLLDELDQAFGHLPDPRSYYQPPLQFCARLELPVDVLQSEALLFASRRLLAQMAAWLAGLSSGVQRFTFRFLHRGNRSTELVIGLLEPSRDLHHFTLLLRERLAGSRLPEPARTIELTAGEILPCDAQTPGLLPEETRGPGDWAKLVERLRARLGTDAVQGLAVVAEHRPERASCTAAPGGRQPGQAQLEFGARPFWLLDAPKPLDERNAMPHCDGPLELVAGPERIESGWWDGNDIGRDYFIARTGDEALVWVYREHRALDGGRWYLHGLFA